MFRTLPYDKAREKYQFIDVRSPGEFEEYTIPGAINVPLFGNEERHLIGTTYKQCSVEDAVTLGMEYASKNLPEIYRRISEIKKINKDILLFCERGGMRSTSLCSLLNSIGIKVVKLDGGYKGYRAYVNETLPQKVEAIKLIVLHGMTGTAKTDLLKKLKENGHKILDLEGFANHRGSLLGSVGLGKPYSQRTFESLLLEEILSFGPGIYYTEAESSRIGNVILPKYLIDKMKEGKSVLIESSIAERVRRLVQEYTSSENHLEEILFAIDKMEKYTGKRKAEEFKELARNGSFDELAEFMMVSYYDPMYSHGQSKRNFERRISSDDFSQCIEELESLDRESYFEI